MQLPTWGAKFNMVRERAYYDPAVSSLHNYIRARSMDFCECCGLPGAPTIVNIAEGKGPRSYIALCGQCCSGSPYLSEKVDWLESNLDTARLLYVTAALISNPDGTVMVCQKSNSLWEFPGGKMNEGEDLGSCLRREIREELAVSIVKLRPFLLVDHDYGHIRLRLFSFTAELSDLSEKIRLQDHIKYRFERVEDLSKVSFSQADVAIAQRLALNVM